MLTILESAMLIGGIYAIVAAKVPAFLVGGGKYQVEGAKHDGLGFYFFSPYQLLLSESLFWPFCLVKKVQGMHLYWNQ